MEHPQQEFMQEAIKEAKLSASSGQYAIGAVVVNADGQTVSISHTSTHRDSDPTAHAEVNAIRAACQKLQNRYLEGCWLYTTLEPCPMCVSAVIWAKMEGVVFGASKEDAEEYAVEKEEGKFSWRQINLSSRDVVAKGEPEIKLIEKFMREECLLLFSLS